MTQSQPGVLVGVSIDAVGAARLPGVLADAGLEVTVICPPGIAITSSRFVKKHISTGRSISEVRQAIEEHLRGFPDFYAQVLVADEPLIREFVESPSAAGKTVAGDSEGLRRILSKVAFVLDAERAGVPMPAARILHSREELVPEMWTGKLFIVKMDETMSGSGVHIVRSRADLERVKAVVSEPFLVQDYVKGRVGSTAILFQSGKPKCWFSYYLCRNWPNEVSASSAIEICSPPGIEDILNRIGGMTGFEGLCGIDWVVDPESGKPLVLEMNPRPTPGIYASGPAGVSFPAAIADMLAGGTEVQRPREEPQLLYRMFPQHLYWAIDARRPWEFVRTFANAPWRDPNLLLSQFRRVLTHYLPLSLRERLRRAVRGEAVSRRTG